MALVKCPECGKEISSDAKACPNCGHPLTTPKKKMSKAAKIILIIVAVLIAAPTLTFVGCIGTAAIFSSYGKVGGAELTVTLEDGTEEKIAANELKTEWEENEMAASEKYSGQQVSFTDKVKSVNGPTLYDGHEMEGYIETENQIIVEVDESDLDFAKTLTSDDSVKIVGTIVDVTVARRVIVDASYELASIELA